MTRVNSKVGWYVGLGTPRTSDLEWEDSVLNALNNAVDEYTKHYEYLVKSDFKPWGGHRIPGELWNSLWEQLSSKNLAASYAPFYGPNGESATLRVVVCVE